MSQAPSYEELKESEHFWLQVTPYIAGMNETLDGGVADAPISSFLYYESNITATDDGYEFPFKELRINISERSSEEIQSLSGKYPIGFLQFYEDSASATLMCRNELVSRMISTLGIVKDNEIEFFITLPALPSKLPNVFPVLNFQYRVCSFSSSQNA
ncbi:hypothetical protein [Plesiomonas shigelloides]|uniref:hypothetical protein n=1 Tax=Plesiomonas shigelloides TaxID=703 RepID=UPI00387F19D0